MQNTALDPLILSVRNIGGLFLFGVQRAGRMGIFLAATLYYAVSPPIKFSRVLQRIRFLGFQSTLVILLTGIFSGMVLGLQGFYTLNRFGSSALLGPMIALTLIKELGPVFTGLMVTARAGSAVTAEIGIMRITEQIDALELMGLNPLRYLVVPTLIAALVAIPLLTAIFDVLGILGGYLVGVRLLGIGSGTYFGEMTHYVDMKDILEGIYKSLSFAVLMVWVCCYKGYYSGFGAEGVSKATTQAVVLTAVLILVWDYFMTALLF